MIGISNSYEFTRWVYAIHWARKGHTAGVGNKTAFLWQEFPKFVLGFLLIPALATAHVFSGAQCTAVSRG